MAELEHHSALSRRAFLVGLAGTAITFGFAPAEGTAEELGASPFEPTIWYSVDRSGIVTVNITRAEMGQHIGTAVARIVADELEVDWSNVRISAVDTDPKWGYMVTGGSHSVWQDFPLYSRAGAAGRIAFIDAGAKLLGVSPSQCVARRGAVFAANQSISYGQIVSSGEPTRKFMPDELAQLPIKPASERRLIGKKADALDIPAKINGTARYGIDAAVEGMVYARPKIPPTRNGSVVRAVDDSAAKRVKGYLTSIVLEDPSNTVPGWVVVCATSYPAAIRAADLVKVDWTAGDAAHVSEKDILDYGAKQIAAARGGALLVDDPGIESAFRAAGSTFEQTYTTSSVLHAQLEPVNALAFEKDGRFEIHTGSQWQSLILPVLAQALRLPQERIVMRTYPMGGGFGRRLNGDYAVPAALAAKALGRPVKLVLTRPDDMRFDSFRSPSIQTLRLAFNERHNVTAMEHHASAGWPTGVVAPAVMPKTPDGTPYDQFVIDGADHWYSVGAQACPRALERPCQQRVSPRLAALGRTRLDQLGARDLHGRGGADGGCGPCRIPHRSVGWGRPQRRLGAERGRRSEAPGSSAQACGGKGRVGFCHAQGYSARRRHHIRSRTSDADMGGLRRARARRPRERRCRRGKAHDRRRCGHRGSSGRGPCTSRRQRPLGRQHGAA